MEEDIKINLEIKRDRERVEVCLSLYCSCVSLWLVVVEGAVIGPAELESLEISLPACSSLTWSGLAKISQG